MWMLELLVLTAVFVGVFFKLIRTDGARFVKLRRLTQVFLGICAVLLIALMVDSGFGMLFFFFLFFGALAGASYFLFLKGSQKAGFIGLSFCLTFSVIFAYLQFVILNFDF